MKPIGQTFFINEPPPPTGAPGVYLTRVDIFFKQVSQNYGIELQIRYTENGVPTPNQVPFGKCLLLPNMYFLNFEGAKDGEPLIRASNDASLFTPFKFDTPVYLESNKSYTIVLIPQGGTPEYLVWTAEIGGTDVLNKSPITTNNDTGDLFLSSNDLTWVPVITEDFKFKIYTANFTASSGYAVFVSPDEEIIKTVDRAKRFQMREPIVYGETYYRTAVLNLTSNNGVFSVGDTVYQANSTANVAVGKVYAANSQTIKVANTIGTFNTSNTLYDSNNALANAVISTVYQNVITTTSSNTVTVPDASIYNQYQYLFFQTSTKDDTQVVWVTEKTNNTTIKTSNQIRFSDDSAQYGPIVANSTLNGRYSGIALSYPGAYYSFGPIDSSSANSSVNLGNKNNLQLIGLVSGASANLVKADNRIYNSITTNFNTLSLPNTSIEFSFKGVNNDVSYTTDPSYIPITEGIVNELIDTDRLFMSRSNEYANLPTPRKGDHTFQVKIDMASQNNKVSPVIDLMQKNVTFHENLIDRGDHLNGYYLLVNTNIGTLSVGDVVSQNTASFTGFTNSLSTGVVYNIVNNSFVAISNVAGNFIDSTVYNTNAGANGNVTNARLYREEYQTGYYNGVSRYISKNVILETGQDSEDIVTYLTAYRPPNTNIYVYTSIINSHDSEQFSDKHWSRLVELSSPSLLSSKTDIDDQLELSYGFPKSQYLFMANTVLNNGANSRNFNANTEVNNTYEFITINGNVLSNNDIVTYTVDAGNTALDALTANTSYYVVGANSTGVKLSNTLNGTPINLIASTISEDGHNLTSKFSLLVTCQSTDGISNNSFVYFLANNTNTPQQFNVREVIHVLNATAFVVDRYPSFADTNASLGIIPNLESTQSAFSYDLNNGIVRYSTFNDGVYDTYIQFATKIVMVSDTKKFVPRINDVRAIALQL